LPQSSGAVAVGEDEYLIARSNKGFDSTGASVKLGAIKEADAFFDQQNRVSEIIEASQQDYHTQQFIKFWGSDRPSQTIVWFQRAAKEING
jgi:hypothetical protein